MTERTAALLEQTSLVSSIFQSVPEAMMTRTTEGIITSWNPGCGAALRLHCGGNHWQVGSRADAGGRTLAVRSTDRQRQTSRPRKPRKPGGCARTAP